MMNSEISNLVNKQQSGITIEDFVVKGFATNISVRLYRPTNAPKILPALLYLHGGGFIRGSIADAEVPSRFIALHASIAVLSVAYSLAPDYPFPAAPEDVYASALWLIQNASDLHINVNKLAIAGDDAGGNLAAAVALIARDRRKFQLKAQALIGPMLDPSMTKLGDAQKLKSDTNLETCAQCYLQYLPRVFERLHPYASPAESNRFQGVPPTLIATAEKDVLRCEAEHFATSLIEAGIPTQVNRFAINHSELAKHEPLLKEVAIFLQRHLHSNSQ